MADLTYSQQFKKIKDDVRLKYNKITKELAKEAQKDMTHVANSILKNYYDSYIPSYYNRTYNLYHMIFNKYTITEKDNGHVGSISATPLFMLDNYNTSPVTVYDLVWNQGHRGLPNQWLNDWDTNMPWYPRVDIYGEHYYSTTPHMLMTQYLKDWYKTGQKKAKKIGEKYCTDEYKKFV